MEEDKSTSRRASTCSRWRTGLPAARASDEVVSVGLNSGGLVLGNFGDNAALLGDCEERARAHRSSARPRGGLGQAFRQMATAALPEHGAGALHGGGRREAGGGVPRRIVYAARHIISCTRARRRWTLRSEALLRLQTARAQAEKRRAKLEKLPSRRARRKCLFARATAPTAPPTPPRPRPGPARRPKRPPVGSRSWRRRRLAAVAAARGPAETAEDLQREAEAADSAREHARVRYEEIKATMRVELPRLHAELESVLNAAFCATNAALRNLANAQAEAWRR